MRMALIILSAFCIAQDDFMIVAHRGASGFAPENTLSAFQLAIDSGANYLEVDVHLSKDQEVVGIHDSSLNRTTNGWGAISSKSLKELKTLDAGSWFSSQFRNEKIPTLKEILSLLPRSGVKLIIEVKGTYPGIEQKIWDIVQEEQKEELVIFKSFSLPILRTFESLAPDIPRLYVLFGTLWGISFDTWFSFGSVFSKADFVQTLQVHRLLATQSFIDEAHQNNFNVIVWGVDTKAQMDSILSMGVEGIETNYPKLLKQRYQNTAIAQ